MPDIELFTIGFTRKTAQQFFGLLRDSGARRIVDVRLNNVSQLAGFAKRDDLKFFAREICGVDYVHVPELAPTQEMLAAYKNRKGKQRKGGWNEYADQFLHLMEERKIEETVPMDLLDRGCLLCSEDKPDNCHRLLVAQYLQSKWDGTLAIRHLF